MTEAIEELLKWATSHGIILNGITPKILPGRGVGIVAARKIQAEETILKVPTTILRTLGNTPTPVVDKLRGATVHAILAVGLCLDTAPDLAIWRAVFPSKADLATAMPICWPPELQDLLPAAAKALLMKQKANFDKDWAHVSRSYPDIPKDDFLYAWLLVLTRTFYHVTSRTAKLAKTEHMVLQPIADLFNHSPDGCTGSFRADAFAITAWRAYEPGEEVFIRYGAHSNDTLLVEYGFTLAPPLNVWDETSLDAYVCPLCSGAQRRQLEEARFWGAYKLDARTLCYRTQIALRRVCLPEKQWRAVLEGERDEDEDQDAVDAELRKILRQYEKDARRKMLEIERLQVGDQVMRDSLRERWVQVKDLVVAALSRLEQ